jgi:hypothetical protein
MKVVLQRRAERERASERQISDQLWINSRESRLVEHTNAERRGEFLVYLADVLGLLPSQISPCSQPLRTVRTAPLRSSAPLVVENLPVLRLQSSGPSTGLQGCFKSGPGVLLGASALARLDGNSCASFLPSTPSNS